MDWRIADFCFVTGGQVVVFLAATAPARRSVCFDHEICVHYRQKLRVAAGLPATAHPAMLASEHAVCRPSKIAVTLLLSTTESCDMLQYVADLSVLKYISSSNCWAIA
jgi:hypothetical protein